MTFNLSQASTLDLQMMCRDIRPLEVRASVFQGRQFFAVYHEGDGCPVSDLRREKADAIRDRAAMIAKAKRQKEAARLELARRAALPAMAANPSAALAGMI